MQRETKEIEMPVSKQNVVIRPWLTGGERRQLTYQLQRQGIDTTQKDVKAITPEANDAIDHFAWNMVVVSIGGLSDDIPAKIEAMHEQDYVFLTTEINNILKGTAITEKKTN